MEARELLALSPSRRLTSGYFGDKLEGEILSPHRSGSSGQWVATVKSIEGKHILVVLRHDLRAGDRLRPESSEGREKKAFTVGEMLSKEGNPVICGRAGEKVFLVGRIDLRRDERLIRVGIKLKSSGGAWQRIRNEVASVPAFGRSFPHPESLNQALPRFKSTEQRGGETLIVKVARAGDLPGAFESPARWVMLTATRSNLERLAKQRLSGAQKNRFVWSLPPLITEKQDQYYRLAVRWFCERDFHAWELNNWGHFDFFGNREALTLFSGYRFNVRNLAAMAELAEAGCRWSVLSLEITREELQLLGPSPFGTIPIVTLYSWPPLFTSRLLPKLGENKPFRTPREDTYFFEKSSENALIYGDCPVNWLDHLPVLRGYGFRNFLLDLSDGPQGQLPNLERLLQGCRESRADQPFSLFNLDRRSQ